MRHETRLRRQPFTLALAIVVGAAAVSLAGTGPAASTRASDDPALRWGPCPAFMPEGCAIAVLHGDPAEPNADVLFRVPAGSSIPSHWHNSAERMVLVAGDMTVRYDGHEPASLRPGSYAYGPAKLPHTARCSAAAPCVLFIAFEGPVDTFATSDGRAR